MRKRRLHTRRIILLIFFATTLLVQLSYGYLPGDIIIRKCPNSSKAVKQETTLSGNTIGARYWTDEKKEAPMLPDRPWLVKCPQCSHLFWVDEAEELGWIKWSVQSKKWQKALSLLDYRFTEKDLFKAVKLIKTLSEEKKTLVHEIK